MVRIEKQGEHASTVDVWTRFVDLLSGMLQQMPGRNHKEFWMQSHIPALMVSLWRAAPTIFTKTFELSDAAKAGGAAASLRSIIKRMENTALPSMI